MDYEIQAMTVVGLSMG